MATATDATTFHMGERISLQLDFTAGPDGHFGVITANYDRSGRMNYESFEVSPSSGFSDPLAGYFSGGFFGGGLTGFQELTSKPYTMHLDLNEWVRFDSPGDYTVTVHSSRVSSLDQGNVFVHTLTVTSNPIKLHIIPAMPEWQKATLARAVQALAVKHNPNGPVPDETAGAIADVRFLGSAEAIPVLVAGLGDDQTNKPFAFALGLIGLPPALNDVARRAVRERIDDPDVAVSSTMLMAYGGLTTDSGSAEEHYFEARRAAQEDEVQVAIAALPRKTGKAKASTADLLLREHTGSLTPEDKAAIARALGAGFTELPEDKQAILLQWQWGVLRSAISAQTLEKIASLPVSDPSSRVMQTYNRMQLKSAALSRWYELDPQAAKRAAYAQIDSERPSLTAEKLWFLPAEPLPQFESIWAEALLNPSGENNAEVLAALMTRFGTGAFASQMAAMVRASLQGGEACAPEDATLAYVVKFNPDLARPLLQDALQARNHTGCYRRLFENVAKYTTSAVLTDAAIKVVADPDPETAEDALRYLSVYGDERSKAAILNRYLAWAQEWAGRGDELEAGAPFKPSPNWQEQQLGQELGHALLVNQGWIADSQLRAEVVEHCVGEQMCRFFQQDAGAEGSSNHVEVIQGAEGENIVVGPYQIPNLELLKAKLSQYPRGTEFGYIEVGSSMDEGFLRQVWAAFDDAGMKLSRGM